MIYPNIAEYEENDSQLARLTIAGLHGEINRLNNIINELKERCLHYSEEIDKLLDIKEEVREYVELELSQGGERDIRDLVNGYAILEILDKVDKEGNDD